MSFGLGGRSLKQAADGLELADRGLPRSKCMLGIVGLQCPLEFSDDVAYIAVEFKPEVWIVHILHGEHRTLPNSSVAPA